ncbi:MAG: hydantoinase/oxoprolinase family protein [Candidatus Methanoliparum thermophilum]|uniref:Hydantoinase/oxoprolinase family protein n=1 Tax=Methanoliparum thermophilum TaxID=2491083 RepID=A0A520KUC9_METT2|nr:MAG: hydantoinase/oxoprolinase family protein [Candidatus Methanoliparum thermophilum]
MKFIGIDVGGTNTDAVKIEDGIIDYFKIPNEWDSIIEALKKLGDAKTSRTVVSSSLSLNLLYEEKGGETKTLIMAGPGLNFSNFGTNIEGCINHRGDIVEDIVVEEVVGKLLDKKDNLAVVGKFSNRNPSLEEKILNIALNYYDSTNIALGSDIQGLSFPRRINTTILSAKVKRSIVDLTKAIENYSSSFYYFKGDGGIVPHNLAIKNPLDLVNSSPATAALGAYYLTGEKNGLVIDIGGTTTDFIELVDGKPKLVENIELCGYKTLIRSVDTWVVPIGGDSYIDFSSNSIGLKRKGNAVAFKGEYITLTDLLNCIGEKIGDYNRSISAMKMISNNYRNLAESLVEKAIDLISKKSGNPSKIICTGYLGKYLAPMISERLNCSYIVPKFAEVANAIGAAVSRISLMLYQRIDTERGRIIWNGTVERIKDDARSLSREEIIDIAKNKVRSLALRYGAVEEDVKDVDLLYFNSYNIIRGWYKSGQISDCIVQINPGISSEVKS